MLGPRPARLHASADRLATGWWQHTSTGPATVFPDGVIDILWRPGQTPWLAGPDTEPWQANLAAGVSLLGLSLHIGAAGALARSSTTEFVGQRVDLDAMLPAAAIGQLTERLDHVGLGLEAAQLLADELAHHLPTGWQPDPVVEAVCLDLRLSGFIEPGRSLEHGVSIEHSVSIEQSGLSQRQLRRRFSDAVGYGPALYRRICRLDRFAASAKTASNADISLGQLAADAGYHDQSHLVRDCRALTGLTPTKLLS